MTESERATRARMDDASVAHNVRESAWVRNARAARLPYKVYADARTDTRVHVVRETASDVLRRTMPKGDDVPRAEFDRELDEVRERHADGMYDEHGRALWTSERSYDRLVR